MSVPLEKQYSLIYGDTYTKKYQLFANGAKVADDLTAQTITLHIISVDNGDFTPIEKDIVTQGWVFDNTNKIIRVVIDTETYLMNPGRYTGVIIWEDQDRTIVKMDIYVNPAVI